MKITTISKPWWNSNGTALVTIKKNEQKLLELKKGDQLKITIEKIDMNPPEPKTHPQQKNQEKTQDFNVEWQNIRKQLQTLNDKYKEEIENG